MKLLKNSLGLFEKSFVNLDTLNQIHKSDIWIGSINNRTQRGIGLCPKEVFYDYLKLNSYDEMGNSPRFSSTLLYFGSPLYLRLIGRIN